MTVMVRTALARSLGGDGFARGRLLSPDALDEVEACMRELGGDASTRCGEMVSEQLAAGGKRVRARLALAATEALGGDRRDAVAWAAACELLHNATLVHDDLQDGDTVRRGVPTTWVRHGAAQAINAGDLMLMLPFRAIEAVPVDDGTRWALSRATARAAERTVRGQSFEQDMLPHRRMSWDDWWTAAVGKTGALLALPVEGAARMLGCDDALVAAVGDTFTRLGVMFQLHDDLLDLTHDKGRGVVASDLYEGKVSALVVEHLTRWPEEAAALVTLLDTPRAETAPEVVARMVRRFEDGGAVAGVRARIAREHRALMDRDGLDEVPALRLLAAELMECMERSTRDAGARGRQS